MSVIRSRILAWALVLLLVVLNESLGVYVGPEFQDLIRVLLLLVISLSTLWLIVRQYRADRRLSTQERARRKAEKREILKATAETIVADLKAKRD